MGNNEYLLLPYTSCVPYFYGNNVYQLLPYQLCQERWFHFGEIPNTIRSCQCFFLCGGGGGGWVGASSFVTPKKVTFHILLIFNKRPNDIHYGPQ